MTSLNLRFPDGLHEKIKELAEINHRSLNSEILVAIERYVKQEQEKKENEKEKVKSDE